MTMNFKERLLFKKRKTKATSFLVILLYECYFQFILILGVGGGLRINFLTLLGPWGLLCAWWSLEPKLLD